MCGPGQIITAPGAMAPREGIAVECVSEVSEHSKWQDTKCQGFAYPSPVQDEAIGSACKIIERPNHFAHDASESDRYQQSPHA